MCWNPSVYLPHDGNVNGVEQRTLKKRNAISTCALFVHIFGKLHCSSCSFLQGTVFLWVCCVNMCVFIYLYYIYAPPTYNKVFITEFSEFLSGIVTLCDHFKLCCPSKPLVSEFFTADWFLLPCLWLDLLIGLDIPLILLSLGLCHGCCCGRCLFIWLFVSMFC